MISAGDFRNGITIELGYMLALNSNTINDRSEELV